MGFGVEGNGPQFDLGVGDMARAKIGWISSENPPPGGGFRPSGKNNKREEGMR
jgi:hypothetical protein